MKPMEKLIAGLILVAGFAGMVFLVAVLSGTILYFIYPHIHALFPTAAEKGIIAKELGWWDSVCITWLFGILLKSTNKTVKNEKD